MLECKKGQFERFLFAGRYYTPAYEKFKKKRKQSTGDYSLQIKTRSAISSNCHSFVISV